MNPAALKVHLPDLPRAAWSSSTPTSSTSSNLKKAGYAVNPLQDGTSAAYRVFEVPIGTLNARALDGTGLTAKEIDRSKNMFALGLMFWMYSRPLDADHQVHRRAFSAGRNPKVAEANLSDPQGRLQLRRDDRDLRPALPRAEGEAEARPLPQHHRQRGDGAGLPRRQQARRPAAVLRQLPDHARQRRPARALAGFKRFGVKTFQAEDEIAAIGVGHRRLLRRPAGHDRHVRPRHRPQERGHRPRRDG